MHRPEEPVAAAISGEHTTRPIGAVGSRSKPEHDNPRIGIAESRYRAPPVRLVAIGSTLFDSDAFAPLDETGTHPTVNDLTFKPVERTHDTRQ